MTNAQKVPTFHDLAAIPAPLSLPSEPTIKTMVGKYTRHRGRNRSLVEWKQECALVHDDKYDYSRVADVARRVRVVIICPDHGEFKQLRYKHLIGQGCPTCAREKRLLSPDEIKQYLAKHNPTVIYVGGYKNSREHASFKCATCAHEWTTVPNVVIHHEGKCPLCAKHKCNKTRYRDTPEQFSEKLALKRGGKFTLAGEYSGSLIKTNFTCVTCKGYFKCTPNQMLSGGKRCPYCKTL